MRACIASPGVTELAATASDAVEVRRLFAATFFGLPGGEVGCKPEAVGEGVWEHSGALEATKGCCIDELPSPPTRAVGDGDEPGGLPGVDEAGMSRAERQFFDAHTEMESIWEARTGSPRRKRSSVFFSTVPCPLRPSSSSVMSRRLSGTPRLPRRPFARASMTRSIRSCGGFTAFMELGQPGLGRPIASMSNCKACFDPVRDGRRL